MVYRSWFNGPGVLLALMLVIFSPVTAHAQEAEQTALRKAFAAGDARAVLEVAASRVEVGVFGNSSQYSRSQAVYVLQDFFENHPPRQFSWRETSVKGESRFLTGNYSPASSKRPLPVYLRLAKGGEGWQLQEVRVERP